MTKRNDRTIPASAAPSIRAAEISIEVRISFEASGCLAVPSMAPFARLPIPMPAANADSPAPSAAPNTSS